MNASDNYTRDKNTNEIRVEIDLLENSIKIFNNGLGVPIANHKKYKILIPIMVFGELLTGSNFNDNVKKTTGGRNGFGAKLTNIYSKKFELRTADKKN